VIRIAKLVLSLDKALNSESLTRMLSGLVDLNDVFIDCCLICFVFLLLYSCVWRAYLIDIQLLPVTLYEKRVTGLLGVKGFCFLMVIILCSLLFILDVIDAGITAFIDIKFHTIFSIRVTRDVILFVSTFLFLLLTIFICAKVIYITRDKGRFRDSVVYANAELGETEEEVGIRTKRGTTIYLMLSCLLFIRQITYLISEAIYLKVFRGNFSKSLYAISEWCVLVLHWFFIVSFAIMYYMPLNKMERRSLSQREGLPISENDTDIYDL
jgi:hypothetical protein